MDILLDKIENSIAKYIPEDHWDVAMEMVVAMYQGYFKQKPISAVYWYERFNDEFWYNQTLKLLCKLGVANVTVNSNFGKIEAINVDKFYPANSIMQLKRSVKLKQYLLTDIVRETNNKVKTKYGNKATGLLRKGFAKAASHKFTYDVDLLEDNLSQIAHILWKDLAASTQEITYDEMIADVLSVYLTEPSSYSLNENISDSRGRSIFQCQKKIFNPISNKEARALVVLPEEHQQRLDDTGLQRVYAAVAELYGGYLKDGDSVTYADKVQYGKRLYGVRALPDKMEDDTLHEWLWLTRLYTALDKHHSDDSYLWDVPIEIDATASMLGILGVLTNNTQYLTETNIIGDYLEDIWTIPGCTRLQAKRTYTPTVYASSKNPTELLDKAKIAVTQKQLHILRDELYYGKFKHANEFKDYIIENVQPKAEMKVRIWDDVFWVFCNRFQWEETEIKSYPIYTPRAVKRVEIRVQEVPDLKQFKRYFQTLLIHNLDSQIANSIAGELDWIIPNHDAFIVHPNSCVTVEDMYCDKLYEINRNRHTILRDYFLSIGVPYQDMDVDKDTFAREDFKHTVLK